MMTLDFFKTGCTRLGRSYKGKVIIDQSGQMSVIAQYVNFHLLTFL